MYQTAVIDSLKRELVKSSSNEQKVEIPGYLSGKLMYKSLPEVKK